MKVDYEQFIIDLAYDEFRHSQNPNRMYSTDLMDTAEQMDRERKIKRLKAEIMSLREEINMRENNLNLLEKRLENAILSKKKSEFTKTVERVKQKLQTIEGLAEYLPNIRPGPRSKFESLYEPKIYKKKIRDIMLVEELKRRKTKKPERPVTSRTSPDETHANDLAIELHAVGKKRLGYQTIRKAWDNRDKN